MPLKGVILRVFPPLPLEKPLSYYSKTFLPLGARVLVPVKGKYYIGLVVETLEGDISNLLPIEEIVDPLPLITQELLSFWQDISYYYLQPLGKIINKALPPGFLKKIKGRKYSIKKEGSSNISQVSTVEPYPKQFEVEVLEGFSFKKRTLSFLENIKKALSQGSSCLILVPEIVDIHRWFSVLKPILGNNLSIYSSELASGKRRKLWKELREGQNKVVLGTRSAIFLPFLHLSFIGVEKENSSSYFQEKGFPYNARDLILLRAPRLGAKVLLTDKFLSVRTIFRVQTKRYKWFSPPSFSFKSPINISVIDLKDNKGFFSKRLINKIKISLAHKKKVLLFWNRLGFASQLICKECGYVWSCPKCKVSLSYYKEKSLLLCKYCYHVEKALPLCPKCGGSIFYVLGTGIERIEEIIKKFFPKEKIVRIDSQKAKNKTLWKLCLQEIKEASIILGTKIIKRIKEIPSLDLIGIILAEQELNFPDFRAGEKTAELIMDLIDLFPQDKGEILIQTYRSDHYLFQALARKNLFLFYKEELYKRKFLGFPPFFYLGFIEIIGKNPSKIEEGIFSLVENLEKNQDIDFLGPIKDPYSQRGFYRWHLLLRSKRLITLRECLEKIKQKQKMLFRGTNFRGTKINFRIEA